MLELTNLAFYIFYLKIYQNLH